ncbi:hypothetical protein V4V60_003922 [Vibrio mimicus]|uniref:hypothetical protein n=1 Tax=Vibrio TaxID=662 RepID=UPI00053C82D3|nr:MULTISPECIES: hypothetical protein [Vibrio]MCD2151924.1 hypothetical protein [Vibrio parahaemolyticus]HCE3105449.1 hypothetical protein [Vibrio parahaemolyticus]HCJ4668881.1 hypothetical protein [Vibrio parahaemolyticus]
MSFEILSVFSSLLLAMGSVVIALIYYKSSKDRKYNEERNRVELHALRESYESKIYDLMDRLISNESRWKDTNHLVVSAQENKSSSKRDSFLAINGVPENVVIDSKSVFVLTPYHEKFSETYSVIKETCQSVGLVAKRGDEEHISGDILAHTLKLMTKARLVIANIDGRNPNVFYELGIAHALNKDVIIISSSLDDIPVDVKSNRIVLYGKNNSLDSMLKDAITKALV